jgi:hypothetical protein
MQFNHYILYDGTMFKSAVRVEDAEPVTYYTGPSADAESLAEFAENTAVDVARAVAEGYQRKLEDLLKSGTPSKDDAV